MLSNMSACYNRHQKSATQKKKKIGNINKNIDSFYKSSIPIDPMLNCPTHILIFSITNK